MTSSSPEIIRLLQVQSSATEADAVVRQLIQAGHATEGRRVQSPDELIGALAARRWDAVVADFRLPCFGALTALAILKAADTDLPFIVISGTVREGVSMMRAGAHDFLAKSQRRLLPYALSREIRAALGRNRKRAETAEEQLEQDRVTLAMKATRLGIFDYCPQTDKLVLSGPLKEIYGIGLESGCSWRVFLRKIHPAERSAVTQSVIEAMRPGSEGRFFGEHRTIGHADGRERSVIAWGNVIFNNAGYPVRFLGAARDVTGPKRASEVLQKQLQLTRCIALQSADSIFVMDPEGLVTFANPAAEATFGFTNPEFLGRRLHDLLHHHYPDGRPFPHTECGKAIARRNGITLPDHEDLFFHRDGEPIHVSCSIGPLKVDGVRLGVVLTVRNITGRKLAADALRQSEARFRCLEEAGVVGTLIADESGILRVNDYLLDMLGYTGQEFAFRKLNIIEITAPEFRGLTAQVFRAGLETGSVVPYEKKLLRKDGGKVPVTVGAVAIDYEGRRCMFGFVVDQTRHRDLEDRLRQAQKLESVGLLAGGIAHDFNNLLTVILGYTEMMSADIETDSSAIGAAKTIDRIDNIAKAASHARDLTRQLLTFSRQEPVQLRPVYLDVIVGDVERMLRRLIGGDIEVVLALEAPAAFVCADPVQIEQVLMNLAANARDAMPDGGKFCIETSRVELDSQSRAFFSDMEPGRYVQLVVSDSGKGMPPEVSARIFEPFFTTKERGRGTGLGQATVYGIVKRAGGSLSVHSIPDLGTTFRILFPEVDGGHETAFEAELPTPADGSENILLVEDEDAVRGYVAELLVAHGYRLLEARNFDEAIALAADHPARIDLLLTDCVLPGGSGDGIARRFSQLRPGSPVILMSGFTGRLAARTGTSLPILEKPFLAADLLTMMRGLLDAKAAVATA